MGQPGRQLLVRTVAERLASESLRACVYDVLAYKAAVQVPAAGEPWAQELQKMLHEERELVELLRESLAGLGAAPAAAAPPGGVDAAVEATRLLAIAADPRRSLVEAVEALLAAELADRAGWHELVELAAALGDQPLARRCTAGREMEARHVERLRAWIAARPDAAGEPVGEPGVGDRDRLTDRGGGPDRAPADGP